MLGIKKKKDQVDSLIICNFIDSEGYGSLNARKIMFQNALAQST